MRIKRRKPDQHIGLIDGASLNKYARGSLEKRDFGTRVRCAMADMTEKHSYFFANPDQAHKIIRDFLKE